MARIYEVVFAPQAAQDFERLSLHRQPYLLQHLIDRQLRRAPTWTKSTRIRQLRGLSRPGYLIRFHTLRFYYDVAGRRVEVLAIVDKYEANPGMDMRRIPLTQMKDDLSRLLREAESEPILITRHGRPAGMIVGFRSDDDWFEYRLEHDPAFLEKVETARRSLRERQAVRLKNVLT